jgi:hypothetical protein
MTESIPPDQKTDVERLADALLDAIEGDVDTNSPATQMPQFSTQPPSRFAAWESTSCGDTPLGFRHRVLDPRRAAGEPLRHNAIPGSHKVRTCGDFG